MDHQLKKSKRFDAAGIEREYPECFKPIPPSRRFSRHNSSASLHTDSNQVLHPDGRQRPQQLFNKLTKASVAVHPQVGHVRQMTGESNGEQQSGDEGQLRYWSAELCTKSPHLFDFVVTLGGDGTVLFASWLFQRVVPPVIPFALGSLGFLTNFDFAKYASVVDSAIHDGVRVNLRMRFTCTVYRAQVREDADPNRRRAIRSGKTGEIFMADLDSGGWEAIEGSVQHEAKRPRARDREVMCFSTKAAETFEVLNDLVVDRGPSPYVSLLELFGKRLTIDS